MERRYRRRGAEPTGALVHRTLRPPRSWHLIRSVHSTATNRHVIWTISHRADAEAKPIADRHYNRQNPESDQFVPPGRCLVLKADRALWVTSWPLPEYVKHAWPGAWVNSIFRKEGEGLASDFIRDAVAATRWRWGHAPGGGLISFIDPLHVKPRKVRGRPAIAESYFAAGFVHVGYTKAGLWVMQLAPSAMPPAQPPHGAQLGVLDA